MNCTGRWCWLVTKTEVVVVDGQERGVVCQEDKMAVVVVMLTASMSEDC